jgi:glycosyltransferase involved in cell wall biosynthesis
VCTSSTYPTIDASRVEIVHNGIDATEFSPDPGTDALSRCGIDPGAALGRVRRAGDAQKGTVHLLDAAPAIDRDAQLVAMGFQLASLRRCSRFRCGGSFARDAPWGTAPCERV